MALNEPDSEWVASRDDQLQPHSYSGKLLGAAEDGGGGSSSGSGQVDPPGLAAAAVAQFRAVTGLGEGAAGGGDVKKVLLSLVDSN